MEYGIKYSDNPRFEATIIGMNIIRDILNKRGIIKREFVSSRPKGNSEYSMLLIADLLDKNRRSIGEIRIHVIVKNDSDDIRFVIEWTRTVFGFWYRKNVLIRSIVNYIDNSNFEVREKLKYELEPIKWTANGTAKVESMNRMFKKIRKSRVKDRAFRVGLMAG